MLNLWSPFAPLLSQGLFITHGKFYDELIFGLTREEFDDRLERLQSEANKTN